MKITVKKYGGDDRYSWAVFKDGRPVITGLNKRIATYEADKLDPSRKVKREKARARRWAKTGVSRATIGWMKRGRML